ncbi:MAG: nucleotidyltransferase domain-containing protein [Planctomycetia bacterium]|nr:nucleotidyltransferase domain-containing protein [Planctomycetia bacterium]MDO5113615.1 nucleotidyltransferase domain-containing protein [Planctomycetia bacterium]
MNGHLPKNVEEEIVSLAARHGIRKVLLFGSRARGDHRECSDIDLAISGGDVLRFSLEVEEEVETLLRFDVVDLDDSVQAELQKEIEEKGVVLYEKV